MELGINKIGNLVEPEAVISKDEKDNRIVQSSRETKPILNISKTSYKELNEIFKISDLKRGQKVSGHRGYFLTGSGVKLALALAQYGLSFL